MLKPPRARQRPCRLRAHGHLRDDPWHWLRDEARFGVEIRAYLEAENAYLDAVLDPGGLRRRLREELAARLVPDEASVPVKFGRYCYLWRYRPGAEHPLLARRAGGPAGPEEVLLDTEARAAGHDCYEQASYEISDDQRWLAFSEDTGGEGRYCIRIKDLADGALLPEHLENAAPDLAFSADGRDLFYVELEAETLRPFRLRRHRLGRPVTEDALVFEETDPAFDVSVHRSRSGDWIYLELSRALSDELRLLPADRPGEAPRVFLPREAGHEYLVDDVGGRFFVVSNWQAENFRLLETDLAGCGDRRRWREILPHREGVSIEELSAFESFLAVDERCRGLRRVRIVYLDGSPDRLVPVEEPAATLWTGTNLEVDTRVLRLGASSMTTPDTVYDYHLDSGRLELRRRAAVRGGFDPGAYRSERLEIPARDGTAVPVSLVYRRPLGEGGDRPLLVYGYGAYGASLDPEFSGELLSLLDRGFVYALAHVRGGQELGRAWYDGGRLLAKQRSFEDFIDVTRGLLDRGYGDRDRVYAAGASAGGLLVGAVLNMAPELFHGAVAEVPFVDVLTTMLDPSLPLTRGEYEEWGDPAVEAHYHAMLEWSPYDQVAPRDYPHLLVTAALHDAQVPCWGPAKWVAKLRERQTGGATILLHTELSAGHGGASGRYRSLDGTALVHAFLLELAGLAD